VSALSRMRASGVKSSGRSTANEQRKITSLAASPLVGASIQSGTQTQLVCKSRSCHRFSIGSVRVQYNTQHTSSQSVRRELGP
jgi:hypothetical protein